MAGRQNNPRLLLFVPEIFHACWRDARRTIQAKFTCFEKRLLQQKVSAMLDPGEADALIRLTQL